MYLRKSIKIVLEKGTFHKDAPVLILGETGTGKEYLAQKIHEKLGIKGKFVPVHCASIPDTLIETELFGHKKGAFTDANDHKKGLLEEAHNGTLFLDEIGDIPYHIQIKLLRVIETKHFRRIGKNFVYIRKNSGRFFC